MKNMTALKGLIFFSCLFVTLIGNASRKGNNLYPDKFAQPVNSSRVHTWWHWVDGMISKEGITKDLESMKQQGITQTTIFNLGFSQNEGRLPGKDFQVKKVDFVTTEWFVLMKGELKKQLKEDYMIFLMQTELSQLYEKDDQIFY